MNSENNDKSLHIEGVPGQASVDGAPVLSSVEEKEFTTIKWLHFYAGLFFFIQTIVYAVVDVDIKVNPTIGVNNNCEGPICPSSLKYLGEVNPIFLIPLFTALASADHIISFLICWFKDRLAKQFLFEIGSNPIRWVEYSISASVMAVAISILTGITDVHLWLLIFAMHSVGMFMGQMLELLPCSPSAPPSPKVACDSGSTTVSPHQPQQRVVDNNGVEGEFLSKHDWRLQRLRSLAYWVGAVSIFTPWLVLACYFFRAVDSDVPDFVYAAFLLTWVFYCCFGVNSYLHNILGWYKFSTAEIVYISLSFTAKTFLAADVFGGLRAADD